MFYKQMKFLGQNKAKFYCDNKQILKSVFVLTGVALSTDVRNAGIPYIYGTYRRVKTEAYRYVCL